MWNNVDNRINQALNRIRKAFRVVLNRTNSGGPLQTSQLSGLATEQLQDAELMQHYGFTSCPLPGTVGVVIPLGGRTSHSVIVATEHPGFRLQALEGGEVAIYTDEGASIILKRGRLVEVTCDDYVVKCKRYRVEAEEQAAVTSPEIALDASTRLGLNTPSIRAGGNDGGGATQMAFNGTINATQDVQAAGISLKGHRHPGDSGGETGTPI